MGWKLGGRLALACAIFTWGLAFSAGAQAQGICNSVEECREVIRAAEYRISELENPPQQIVYDDTPVYIYWGQHRENDGSWCFIDGRHGHHYWPDHPNWFAMADGMFYWRGPHEFVYYGGHPIPGGGWCLIPGPHQHVYYPPHDNDWVYVGGRYTYRGRYQQHSPAPATYWTTPAKPVAPPAPVHAQVVAVKPNPSLARPARELRPEPAPGGRPGEHPGEHMGAGQPGHPGAVATPGAPGRPGSTPPPPPPGHPAEPPHAGGFTAPVHPGEAPRGPTPPTHPAEPTRPAPEPMHPTAPPPAAPHPSAPPPSMPHPSAAPPPAPHPVAAPPPPPVRRPAPPPPPPPPPPVDPRKKK